MNHFDATSSILASPRLASAFLEDEPNLFTDAKCNELAAEIQQTIEDFIAYAKLNYEPPDPPGFEGGFADNH